MKRKLIASIYKRRNRIPLGRRTEGLERELICADCRAVFPEYLGRCPMCGSTEWTGLVEVNPYTTMPMKNFLKICGHFMWIAGTIAFLSMFWQTTSPDRESNLLFVYGGIILLVGGVLCSAGFFGLSELMGRVLRIQRRLHAFHEGFRRDSKSSKR